MTKKEIIAALIKGSQGHKAKFVNVRRDHLLIALDATPKEKDEEPSVVTDQASGGAEKPAN